MRRKTFTAAASAAAARGPARRRADHLPRPARAAMVGAGPGGGTDIIARMLAEKFAEGLKGTFGGGMAGRVQHHRRGHDGQKAPPEGQHPAATNTGQAIAPHLIKLAFDP
jgi:hypothetical protein